MEQSFTRSLLETLADRLPTEGWQVEMAAGKRPKEDRIIIKDGAGLAVAKFWFDRRKDGDYLFFTDDVRRWFQGSSYSKVMKDGWSKGVALSVALACVATRLSNEALAPLLDKKVLCPDGRVPKSAVKAIQRLVQRDISAGRDVDVAGHLWPESVLGAVRLMERKHNRLSGEDVKVALGDLRNDIRFLVEAGVQFDEVVRIWNEETARAVLDG